MNLNIYSKFKKDLPTEITKLINKYWKIDYVKVRYINATQLEIGFANYDEPYINTAIIIMNLKEKTKLWNLQKDFGIQYLLYKYQREAE